MNHIITALINAERDDSQSINFEEKNGQLNKKGDIIMMCKTCFYAYEQRVDEEISTVNVCVRYPPRVIIAGNNAITMFPVIRGEMFCGEYKTDVDAC